MFPHTFLMQSGVWLSEGVITFAASKDALKFYSKWRVQKVTQSSKITVRQTLEIPAISEKTQNDYLIEEVDEERFCITLSNHLMKSVQGRGFLKEQSISWEFRQSKALNGFEVFTKEDENNYTHFAEYHGDDPFKIVIDAKIWKVEEKEL